MGKINVLSFAVANLIAAGEVVDRPASAVKELLENAIDAGATRVTVEIQNGGVTFLRVSDNGCGMEADDLPIAVRRHATSKIKTAEDLDGIETLGFRGEALAAIASVSDMRIISKTADAEFGAMLEVKAGNIISLIERACATGTTIIVENLFANVPARRKFLKRDITEASAVSVWVEKIALSEPSVAIRLIVDGAVKFETEGNGDLKSAVYSIFGRDFSQKLIPVCSEIDGVEVKGFIGRSDNFKANRNFQNFFINGRYIKSKTASAALEQAYSSYIPVEKFPCCILNIYINPRSVDVNVHPAKLEVKFSNEKPIFDAVYYTVRSALEQDVTRPALEFSKTKESKIPNPVNAFVPVEDKKTVYQNLQFSFGKTASGESPLKTISENREGDKVYPISMPKVPSTHDKAVATAEEILLAAAKIDPLPTDEFPPEERPSLENTARCDTPSIVKVEKASDENANTEKPLSNVAKEEVPGSFAKDTAVEENQAVREYEVPEYRIIGEAFHSYVFVETGDRILVIDKHAAHERLLFEDLRKRLRQTDTMSQLMMLPIEVMLTTDELQAIESYLAEIEKIGFKLTLKKHSADIEAVPSGVSTDAVCDMLIVIADRIINETGSIEVSRELVFERALYQASCKAAIKAGREYGAEHIRWLVDQIMQFPDITFCPHGRPIAIEMTKNMLDHQFERK